jgi:pimeloyl-ACP methyl ester carboxylesterase
VKRILLVIMLLLVAAPALCQAPVVLKTTEFGRGSTIVLVHDFGGTRTQWLPTAKRLLANHHVVMVDLPGHGESAMPDPFSLDAAAASLAQVVAKQKGDSTIVVGHGLGGMVALIAASKNPASMKGVVVIDGWTKNPQEIPEQMQKYFLQMLDTNYDAFLKQMFMMQGRDSTEGKTLHAYAVQVPPANIKAYLRQLLNADASGALKGLKPKLLYIGTEKHWPADKKWADLQITLGYAGAPAMESRRIGNTGPLVASQQPDSLASVLDDFAARSIAGKTSPTVIMPASNVK